MLTAIYSFRAVFLTFNGQPRDQHVYEHAHENKMIMLAPMWILAFFSITIGWFNTPFSLALEGFLEPATGEHAKIALFLELIVVTVSIIVSLFGFVYAYARYIRKEHWPLTLASWFTWLLPALENKWYVDRVYDAVIIRPLKAVSDWFARVFDPKVVDGAVNGVGGVLSEAGEAVRKLQNGAIPTYALSIFLGVVVVLFYFLFVG